MTQAESPSKPARSWGPLEPLRGGAFGVIWVSSILSNFGQLILGVGAAWEMTRIAHSTQMVALVQTALMLPMMLIAVPAGAAADMFDRRKVAMWGLGFAMLCAAGLTTLTLLGLVTPWVLLAFCSLIGAGVALYGPAWQASVREQVPPEQLPAAVALDSISYNFARSFGPAVGGVIILVAGAQAGFGTNAVCYLPLFLAFLFWRRPRVSSRLPPERMDRAIVAGVRYVVHSPPIRTVLFRALLSGLVGSAVAALMPVLARDVLKGGAGVYGLMLGVYGVGAVAGAMFTNQIRDRFKPEQAVSLFTATTGVATLVIGLSHSVILTAAAMAVAGAAWMMVMTMLNVGVQLSAPRWVTARALSLFQSALTGGSAVGAWMWGGLGAAHGVGVALAVSGVALILSPLIGLILPMPHAADAGVELFEIEQEPDVALALTLKSGPVVLEVDYTVDAADARGFYEAMQKLQRVRQRNGAFEWSLSRDIGDPEVWTERYLCPTWGDYLRVRSRFTHADSALQAEARAFVRPGAPLRVRRRLERPIGSVRWRADTPDAGAEPIIPFTS